MSTLRDTIVYHLNELRDELRNAHLTESDRIRGAAQKQAEAIRLLIEATPGQSAALAALVTDFDAIHQLVRRLGPDPRHGQIRKAFEVASASIDTAEAALTPAKPSKKAIEMGIAPAPEHDDPPPVGRR